MWTEVLYIKHEVVFAKCQNYKPWPAEVTQIFMGKEKNSDLAEKGLMYRVKFFGSPTYSIHLEKDLQKFNEQTVEKYQKLYKHTTNKEELQILKAIKAAQNKQVKNQEKMMKFLSLHSRPDVKVESEVPFIQKDNIILEKIEEEPRIEMGEQIKDEEKPRVKQKGGSMIDEKDFKVEVKDMAESDKESQRSYPESMNGELKEQQNISKQSEYQHSDEESVENIKLNTLISYDRTDFDSLFDQNALEEGDYIRLIRTLQYREKIICLQSSNNLIQMASKYIVKMRRHVATHECRPPLSMKRKQLLIAIINKLMSIHMLAFGEIVGKAFEFIESFQASSSPNKEHYKIEYEFMVGKLRIYFLAFQDNAYQITRLSYDDEMSFRMMKQNFMNRGMMGII